MYSTMYILYIININIRILFESMYPTTLVHCRLFGRRGVGTFRIGTLISWEKVHRFGGSISKSTAPPVFGAIYRTRVYTACNYERLISRDYDVGPISSLNLCARLTSSWFHELASVVTWFVVWDHVCAVLSSLTFNFKLVSCLHWNIERWPTKGWQPLYSGHKIEIAKN